MNKFLFKYILLFLIISLTSIGAEDKDLNLQPKTKLNRLEGQLGVIKSVSNDLLGDLPNVDPKKDSYSDPVDLAGYQKVKLIDVVLETLASSDLLKSAREKVIQFELKVDDAVANYYPTVDLEYTYGKTSKNPSGDDALKYKKFNDKYTRLIFRQNLYSGGATNFEVKSVVKKLDVSKNQYRIVLEEEIKKAIKAYFGVVFANRTVKVNERNMKKLNKILQIVTVKYDNGAASIGDMTSIKASVANAMTKLVRVRSKFIESLRFYEYIVGGNFNKTLPYEKNFDVKINNFDELFARANEQNKNLYNYYRSIEAEIFKVKNNEASFKPKVDFEVILKRIYDKEDFEEREDSVNTKVKLTYNLFNGGRDKNKVLEVASDIRDLKYRLNEEKKKIRWNLSKLFTSTQSVSQALESTITEIIASRKAVSSYWEAFKLGEQDLQALLQGQKQLNSAETELVKFEEDYITKFFDILELTGDLSTFFDVDPSNPKFIDFSKSTYSKSIDANSKSTLGLDLKTGKTKDNSEKDNSDILTEEEPLNTELVIDEPALNADIEVKTSIDDNINKYLEKFLAFVDESYMIEISKFDNIYDAFKFIKENSIDTNSFAYDTLDNYNLETKVAHNNFEKIEDAQKYLSELEEKNLDKKYEIKQVKDIKKSYDEYITGLKVEKPKAEIKTKIKIVEKIMQPVKKKEYLTNEEFKNNFLAANDNKFTINVSTFTNVNDIKTLLEDNNLYENSLFFRYGDNGELIKLVNGIFDNYVSAEKSLVSISSIDNNIFPVIEKLASVKKLYNDNLEFNIKKEEPVEYEYINVDKNKNIKVQKKNDFKELYIDTINKEVTSNDTLVENSDFIKRYLTSPKNYYSLNIAAFNTMDLAKEYVNKNNIDKETILVISNSGKIMIMYGIYESLDSVNNTLDKLPNFIKKNKPIVHKIFRTQESFMKNNLGDKSELPNENEEDNIIKEAKEKARLEEEKLAKELAEEKARLEEERKQAELKAIEEQRIADELVKKEAEEKARLEEERKQAELKAIEEQRIADELAKKEAEEKARLEEERKQAELKAIEEQRIADELAKKEAEEKARLEEERKQAELKAIEEQRIADELAKKEADEKARLEEERKQAELRAIEEQRIAEELAKKEVEEKARLEEERKQAELKAIEEQRIADELAKKEAEEKARLEEERKQAELKAIEEQRIADELTKKEAEEKARFEEEKKQAELRAIEEQRIAEELAKKEAEEKARLEKERKQAELKAIEEQRIAEELAKKEIESNTEVIKNLSSTESILSDFINAPKDYYTLNVAAFDNMALASKYVNLNNIKDKTVLVISNSGKTMVMYGVYPLRNNAIEALNSLSDNLKRNKPFLQRIFRTQESYRKNNLGINFNEEKTRLEEERKQAELRAIEEQRIAEELAKKEAEEKARLEEERKQAELKAIEEQRIADELAKKEAEEKARLEEERKQAELRAIEEQRIADELAKKETEEKARLEEEKIQAELKAIEEQRIADELAKKEAEEINSLEENDIVEKTIEPVEKELTFTEKVHNFKDRFNTISSNAYTIKLTTIDSNKTRWFIHRFGIEPNYIVIKRANNKSDIYYGLYDSEDLADIATESLHPKVYANNPLIVRVGDAK